MKQLFLENPDDWRHWLSLNHDKEKEIWLIFYKKKSGKPTIKYELAVEEALCFGWIDSIIEKIDEQRYVRKFTPRKNNSNWSESNKKRVADLIMSNRMTAIGKAKVDIAKRNGKWNQETGQVISYEIPPEFQAALDHNFNAKKNFKQLSKSNQEQFIGWIMVARRHITREKRIMESIRLLEKNKKFGIK